MSDIWVLAKSGTQNVPDFASRTHTVDCFIVGSHQTGSWEFKNPRKAWVKVPVEEVPPWTPRCSFCGGGRR
jgi:hypothetical protein